MIGKPDRPETILDAFRDHPDWSDEEREAAFSRLIECFDPDRLLEAVLPRLADLSGEDAEPMLRIIEAHGGDEEFERLAQAVMAQELTPGRLWESLAVLEGSDAFDRHPVLAEWWEDLLATYDQPSLFEELVAQLEDPDEGCSLALEGLAAVEPEIRAEIIRELGEAAEGAGVISFLRLLAFAYEPLTRAAAVDALRGLSIADPAVLAAWRSIAEEHDDPGLVEEARKVVRGASPEHRAGLPASVVPPSIARAFVTGINGEGRGVIVFLSRDETQRDWVGAAFLCDAMSGVLEVGGQVASDRNTLLALFEEYVDAERRPEPNAAITTALGLFGGMLAITGPDVSPSLRYWVERTVGASFRARPTGIQELFGDWDPADVPFTEMLDRSEAVLDARPDWVDRSDATKEIAEEIRLREHEARPDPKRDAGAYRYLFEHRLLGRLELYRRMLYWMAAVWKAEGEEYLGRSAQALAWQLADPQHAVPSHPFLIALTTRSLNRFM